LGKAVTAAFFTNQIAMKKYTYKDLISFGNYVLNQRKNKEEKSDNDAFINDADLKNWQAQKGK